MLVVSIYTIRVFDDPMVKVENLVFDVRDIDDGRVLMVYR